MAFQHVNASTFTTVTPLVIFDEVIPRQTEVSIYNGHSAAIFIGDKTIATSGATIGRTIPNGTSQTFKVNGGDVVYAISAANSAAGAITVTYSA